MSGSSLALLVVKQPHSTGPLRISEAPSTISDVPATIVDTLGLKNPFPGVSALKLDEHAPRPRQFASYVWSSSDWQADFFPYMDVFTVDGRVTEGSAWKTEEPIYAPTDDSRRTLARILQAGAWRARPDFPVEHAARVSAPAPAPRRASN